MPLVKTGPVYLPPTTEVVVPVGSPNALMINPASPDIEAPNSTSVLLPTRAEADDAREMGVPETVMATPGVKV